MEKINKILTQLETDSIYTQFQAFDNISCFTHPVNFLLRIELLTKSLQNNFRTYNKKIKLRIINFLTWLTITVDGAYELKLNLQNRERYGDNILKDEELNKAYQQLSTLLEWLEQQDKEIITEAINNEKKRLIKIMSTARSKALLAVKAESADTSSIRGWINYWSKFGKTSNLRKLKENTNSIIGVDYGLGVFEGRILWGANLVMMNPTLARLALAEDDELIALKNKLAEDYGSKYTKEKLVREATKIAGLKARLALRAPFLLTGFGKVSFQVNPRTYNQPDKLEQDILTLYDEFNKEAKEYDEGLFLDEVLTEKEIEARMGQTNVFFKVDGSARSVYGKIDEVMLKQVTAGKINLIEDDTEGIIEKVLSKGANCNVTVAGFVTDGLWAFFSQMRGHAKARKESIPISHSIITKMGGRVEAAMRWLVLQKLINELRAQNKDIKDISYVEKASHIKNGTLDDEIIRKLAKEVGFVLPEEIEPKDYKNYKGKLFPEDIAICTIAEAITKRSHKIITQLKQSNILKEQGVVEWETGELQASMRLPYKDRFPHVVELAGIYAQGHFPDIALAVEEFETFKADKNAINKEVDKRIIDELYNSIISDEFAKIYEVDDDLKEILTFFGVYKEEYGTRGLKIDEFAYHPFSQQTLFGEVVGEKIPQTDEEKDKIRKGFVGDFNILGDELKK